MKQVIFFSPQKNAKRIKLFIPYEFHHLRAAFKKINSTYWHPTQKLWSIVNTEENIRLVKNLFKDKLFIKYEQPATPVETRLLRASLKTR